MFIGTRGGGQSLAARHEALGESLEFKQRRGAVALAVDGGHQVRDLRGKHAGVGSAGR